MIDKYYDSYMNDIRREEEIKELQHKVRKLNFLRLFEDELKELEEWEREHE